MSMDCSRCSFRCSAELPLVKHVFEAHFADPNFTYCCPVQGCPHVFKLGSTYSSFLSHANRKHGDWRDQLSSRVSTVASTTGPLETNPVSGNMDDGTFSGNMLDTDNSEMECCPVSGPSPVSRSAAQFLLTLKERYRLTQTAVDFAVGSVNQLVSHVYQELEVCVRKELQENDIAIPPTLGDCFTPMNLFCGLESEYQQAKYYREHFGLVEPVSIELGSSYSYQKSGTTTRLIEKKDTFQYIPLIDNLRCIMQNKEICTELMKPHARDDEYLSDFCDGTLFKGHSLFKEDPTALQIIAYFDEVEICNPLGSYRGVHKLALFYFVLGNLHPKLRSTLKSIQLIAAVTYPNLQQYGFEKVLQPFIKDANTLSNGVHMNINGEEKLVRGAVFVMLADTLAAHAIGGFKVGVGFSYRKCRDCLATAASMCSKFRHKDFLPRTAENYDYHCSLLDGPLAGEDSVTYGLNYRSSLNDLNYFHVANTQLPQDIMHVLLEGVVPYELRLMLMAFTSLKKYFTIDLLNERIRCHTYTQEEIRDKPSQIPNLTSSSTSLRQSGMFL